MNKRILMLLFSAVFFAGVAVGAPHLRRFAFAMVSKLSPFRPSPRRALALLTGTLVVYKFFGHREDRGNAQGVGVAPVSASLSPGVSETSASGNATAPGKVRVYHAVGHRTGRDALESVKKMGLLTHAELFKRGLVIEKPCAPLLPGHHDLIYFTYSPNHTPNANEVGYDVDPEQTYVYNREFRRDCDFHKYHGSKVLLSEYIKKLEMARQMRQDAHNGTAIIFDPRSASPMSVSTSDKRCCDPHEQLEMGDGRLTARHYAYLNEVIIPRACIPPEELHFVSPGP